MSTAKSQTAVTCLDGYRAAADIVAHYLDQAEKRRPKRLQKGHRKSAAYREGYHDGLLFAHCMHTMGEYPQSNEAPIRQYLATQTKKPAPMVPVRNIPKRCPWCIPGVDNCHHSQEEIDQA